MIRFLMFLSVVIFPCGAIAQSRVNFCNGIMQESWIYTNSGVARGPITGPSGSWRFELLWAPDGATDSLQFTPTGITNANSALMGPGRISNRFVEFPWENPGMFVQLQVRGWSANLGDTWSEALASAYVGRDGGIGWMGLSGIARYQLTSNISPGAAVFNNGGIALPPGATQIPTFELFTMGSFSTVPEPATFALALTGIGLSFLLIRRRK